MLKLIGSQKEREMTKWKLEINTMLSFNFINTYLVIFILELK